MLASGCILNQAYRIERELGAGGLATVYSAAHVRTGMRVAVKVLHATADPEIRERFAREAYAANLVGHPGVVRVLADGQDGPSTYLVMELVEGKSLKQVWLEAERRLPAAAVGRIIADVLEVLVAAHEKGVIHRDIKPDNILIALDGTTKLADFGIARVQRAATEKTATGTMLGTPAYMAPEQAYARWSEVDERTDLFAVAATAWALLTGTFVHAGSTVPEMIVSACTKPVPSILTRAPGLPAALAAVLDRALAFDKAGRFATAAEMLGAWSRASVAASGDGSTPLAVAGPSVPVARAEARGPRLGRRRLLIASAAVTGAAALGVLATIHFRTGKPNHPPKRKAPSNGGAASKTDPALASADSSVSDARACGAALGTLADFANLAADVLGHDIRLLGLLLEVSKGGDVNVLRGEDSTFFHCAPPACTFVSSLTIKAQNALPTFTFAELPWRGLEALRADAIERFATVAGLAGTMTVIHVGKTIGELLISVTVEGGRRKETFVYDSNGKRRGDRP